LLKNFAIMFGMQKQFMFFCFLILSQMFVSAIPLQDEQNPQNVKVKIVSGIDKESTHPTTSIEVFFLPKNPSESDLAEYEKPLPPTEGSDVGVVKVGEEEPNVPDPDVVSEMPAPPIEEPVVENNEETPVEPIEEPVVENKEETPVEPIEEPVVENKEETPVEPIEEPVVENKEETPVEPIEEPVVENKEETPVEPIEEPVVENKEETPVEPIEEPVVDKEEETSAAP